MMDTGLNSPSDASTFAERQAAQTAFLTQNSANAMFGAHMNGFPGASAPGFSNASQQKAPMQTSQPMFKTENKSQQNGVSSMQTQSLGQSLQQQETKSEKTAFLVCGTRFDVDSKYKLVRPIGHGAYGVVVAAENTQNNRPVAIKKITKAFSNLVETKRTWREIKLLRHFKHPNIIEIMDVMKPDSYDKFEDVYIVSDLMNTDLHQIIASPQPLSDDHVQCFVYQVLRGLKYIHSANVLHRDLKPSNLLLNANCDLKICDFGLARVAAPEEVQQTEYVATRWYRAPEIMLSWKEYTNAIDVWSVGCILGELLLRKPLFPGKDYMNQLHLILDILGTPSFEDTEYIASPKAKQYVRSLPHRKKVPWRKLLPKAPDLALDLLEHMLAFNPAKRISVEDALAHPYLKVFHDPKDEPVYDKPFTMDIENVRVTKESLKALLWLEAVEFHPELGKQQLPREALDALAQPVDTKKQDKKDSAMEMGS